MDADDLSKLLEDEAPRKRRGRPPGSRNRVGVAQSPVDAGPPDVDTILNDQLRTIAAAQKQMASDTRDGFTEGQLRRLHALAAATVRAVEAMARAAKVKQELAERMSPAQVLEAAIQKIEQQPIETINAVIRRLTKVRNGLVGGFTPRTLVTAAEAIAAATKDP